MGMGRAWGTAGPISIQGHPALFIVQKGETPVGRENIGLGSADLPADDVRAQDESHHLVEGVPPAHALAPEAGVGRNAEPPGGV